jgi:hypothetical protein
VFISVADFWARNCLTAPCELEHCRGGESNLWAKIQALFYIQIHVTASVFPRNKFGYHLALWNEFKVHSTLDIEESDEQCLHL